MAGRIDEEYQQLKASVHQRVVERLDEDGIEVARNNKKRVEEVVKACQQRQIPIRIGVNAGSLEKQFEDMPFDMKPHQDSDGNRYDFGFGLNWSGVIIDDRVGKYK